MNYRNARQWKSYPAHSAGCGLLAGSEVSRHSAVLSDPHAQRSHRGSDLHMEQPAHLLLPDHGHAAQTQTAGECQERIHSGPKVSGFMLSICLTCQLIRVTERPGRDQTTS